MEPRHPRTAARRVAAEVRACLARQGLTIADAVDGTGIPKTTLYRKLGGNGGAGSLDLEELFALADFLETTPSEIVRQSEEPDRTAAASS